MPAPLPTLQLRRLSRRLFLLQTELLHGLLHLGERLIDHAVQLRGARRCRDRSSALGRGLILRQCYDRCDMAVEQVYDRLRRAGTGADAEPAEAHEVDALLP